MELFLLHGEANLTPTIAVVCYIDGDTELVPSDAHIIAMEVFVVEITEITETISGEKWITLSVVMPLLFTDRSISLLTSTCSSDSRLKKSLKKLY